MAGLCVLVLVMEMLREGDKVSCPWSQALEAHQSMELTSWLPTNSVLILTSPLEINNKLPKIT